MIGPRARTTARGIEQSPWIGAVGQRLRGEAHAQRGHARGSVMRSMEGTWRGSLLDHLPDDGRRSAGAATKERARASQRLALSSFDGHVEIAAPHGERALARKRRALRQARP